MDIPEWYNPELTIREMSEKAGLCRTAISYYLNKLNLKCKSYKKKKSIPEWYDKNKTIYEMSAISGLSYDVVYHILRSSKLHYKKCQRPSGYHIFKRYSFDEFIKFYNKNLTIQEMSLLSGIPMVNVKSFLNKHKLEYFRLKDHDIEIGKWYSPDRDLSEMSYLSGLSEQCIYGYLRNRNLPFKKKFSHAVL